MIWRLMTTAALIAGMIDLYLFLRFMESINNIFSPEYVTKEVFTKDLRSLITDGVLGVNHYTKFDPYIEKNIPYFFWVTGIYKY